MHICPYSSLGILGIKDAKSPIVTAFALAAVIAIAIAPAVATAPFLFSFWPDLIEVLDYLPDHHRTLLIRMTHDDPLVSWFLVVSCRKLPFCVTT